MENVLGKFSRTVFNRKNPQAIHQVVRKYARKLNEQPKPSFNIFKANPSDCEQIQTLMWKSFHPEEPVTQGIGLSYGPNKYMDNDVMAIVGQHQSIAARSKFSGKLAGVMLNFMTRPADVNKILTRARSIEHTKSRQLLEFWGFVRSAPKLFEKYKANNILEMAYLVIDPVYRNQGLATRLMSETLKRAQEKGFQYVRADITNLKMAGVCEQLGLKKVFEIPFDAYVDESGKPIIKNVKSPNFAVHVYLNISEEVEKNN